MATRLPLTIRLEQFEGPLDLLLFLIQSNELDVSKVSLGKITDQYLIYIEHMTEMNFDIASEFLVMAATLIVWKSRSLLPQEVDPNAVGEEDDVITQEELIRQILERKRFLEMATDWQGLPMLGDDVFSRPNRKPPIERVWCDMNISDMALSYQEMLIRARKRGQILKKETVSVAEKIYHFADRLEVGKLTEMRDMLTALPSKGEWVVTFLASLELARMKKLKVYQNQAYDPIFLELIETLKGINLSLMMKELQTFDSATSATPSPEGIPL
ncbi:MAG: segregation/condensation protein A [Xanthomonadaceae bacterium]|nr:segregation/condensation protein A [Xanthomonadaceae bacterium]